MSKKIIKRTKKRILRVRGGLGTERPRLSIFRSLNHIYAQVIDDLQQKTLIACSSLELDDLSGDKKNKAFEVGKELAKRAKANGIESVVFDRGRYLFHGRVKALADGAREGGLII